MPKPLVLNLSRSEEICNIGKALSSPVRVEILKLLLDKSLSIVEISEALNIAQSSAALHVKMLEAAGLINAEVQPGTRGAVKLCSRKKDTVTIDLVDAIGSYNQVETVDMPVGAYTSISVNSPCGLGNERGIIGQEDMETWFFMPEHLKAQILWTSSGYVEYSFPNRVPDIGLIKSVSFTMEICSEAPNYREDWPSEITAWMNGVECGTFLSPGDYGARRGKLTPLTWSSSSTQYGLLTTWSVKEDGCYINNNRVGDVTVKDLKLAFDKPITLRIGNKEDAKFVGGFNIFGEKYGDYPQNIIMNIEY
ncbi:MAG: helix-turn-helix domain-containing protein [Lachnospiraceae bacterium]|nr:helix-turn-helix domain-containing protein [Lachnospiraceae bacterium]